MRTPVIVQARMTSTRLPGKVLLPLGARVVLGHIVDRCRPVVGEVVVATSTDREDDAVEAWCRGEDVPCVRGSRDDVLARYVAALDVLRCDAAIRVTADCPLVDPEVLAEVAGALAGGDADHVTTAPGWPLGLSCEGFRAGALREAARVARDAPSREHVTLHLYRHPERFRCLRLGIAHGFAEPVPRLTLDEPADAELLRAVYARFPAGAEPTRAEVAALFRREPELARINAHVRQKPA